MFNAWKFKLHHNLISACYFLLYSWATSSESAWTMHPASEWWLYSGDHVSHTTVGRFSRMARCLWRIPAKWDILPWNSAFGESVWTVNEKIGSANTWHGGKYVYLCSWSYSATSSEAHEWRAYGRHASCTHWLQGIALLHCEQIQLSQSILDSRGSKCNLCWWAFRSVEGLWKRVGQMPGNTPLLREKKENSFDWGRWFDIYVSRGHQEFRTVSNFSCPYFAETLSGVYWLRFCLCSGLHPLL